MKSKVIKKALRFFLYLVGAILLFAFLLYYSFKTPVFQTWVSGKAAWYFSNQWNTTVRVEGVDVELWEKVVLEGVYVEDQHRDTLIYAQELKLDIGVFDLDSHHVFIDQVVLKNATIKLKHYKEETAINFQFIIDEFTTKDTLAKDSTAWDIAIRGVRLDNIHFVYKDENDTTKLEGINYSDISANYVNGIISDISFVGDTTYCNVNSFSLVEKSGFILKKLTATAHISPVLLKLDSLYIATNKSKINTDLSFKYKQYSDFNDFVSKVKMKLQFKSSNIEMADVAYFASELYGLKKRIFLDGTISGKVSDLKGRKVLLVIGDETSYKGNFDISGLPDIDQTFMSFDAKEFRTSKRGIERIPLPPFNTSNYIALPDNVSLFGVVKFKGNFTGFYNDFVSYGKFNTALGFISTDISLKSDSATGMPIYHGKFACSDFELGSFLENEKDFGKVSMNVIVDGRGFKKTNVVTSIEGLVSNLEFNNYNYNNIDLKGKLSRNVFDGFLVVEDDNLELGFNGNIDFSHSPTKINFVADIAKANLSTLNIVKSEEFIGLTGKVDVNATGNTVDDLIGKMRIDNLVYTKGDDIYDFKNIRMSIDDKAGVKTMDFNSFIADAHLSGKFKPMDVGPSINDFLSNYLPTYMPSLTGEENKTSNKRENAIPQQFAFDIKFHNTDIVTEAFAPSVKISCPASMQGDYNESKNHLSFVSDFPLVTLDGYKFKSCSITATTKEGEVSLDANCQRLSLSDSVWIDSINISSDIARDTVHYNVNWHNNTKQIYKGEIPGFIAFLNQPEGKKGEPIVKMKLLPSEITIADSTWRLTADNEIIVDSSFITVRNIDFVSGNQGVRLEGNISEVKEDQMYLMLTAFSLSNLNTYLRGTGLSFYGSISGNTSIGNLYDKPIFGSSLDIKNLKINKEVIGDGALVSVYDSKKDVVNFNGKFKREGGENLGFSGNYFPSKKENSLDVTASVRDFRLDFFEPFIKENFEKLSGLAAAEFKIKGTPGKPLVTGLLNAKVDKIHVNYLGTDYHFYGNIRIEHNAFDFGGLSIYDAYNNEAKIINGKIFHTNYKDFQLDFDLETNKFLSLNTNEKDNSIYYGKVFSTGILNVFGFVNEIILSADIKTDKAKNLFGKTEYSRLFIPLSGSEEVGDNGFISFVKHDTTKKQKEYKVNTSGFTMDFKLELTSDAQVKLLFDEKVGDVIRANGTGDLRMVIDKFGDFIMFGDYTVDAGDYLFTLKNVVNKKFRLEKGGSITWSGKPEDADINMRAIYELRTSLSPLFLSHEHTDAIRKRYPVDCLMNLTGRLLEPDIAFDIYMPTVDDFTRQQAYDKFNNSESEINKQVFSLMFTNTFSPPLGQEQNETASGPGAGTVTSTEVLSNQLSNWLSQISNEFDVGVHYRPGDEVNKDQVELALSTQFFNDKMSVDGSVANSASTNTQNTASVVGDINVDYKLTEDGKFRAKAYNKANEGDLLNTQKGPYTQGLGVFYREEFDTIGELYRRYIGKLKKKNKKKKED